MAIFSKGADPEALVASARSFTRYARTCHEVSQSVGESSAVIRDNWQGDDLLTFTTRIPTVQQQLAALSDTLTRLGERLVDNARAQTQTSGTYAGAGGGAPVAVGPDGGGGPSAAPLAALMGSALFQDGKLVYHLLTSPAKLGSALTWAERIKGLGSFDRQAGVLAEAARIWKADSGLGAIGNELGLLTRWGNLGKVVPFLEEGGKLAKALGPLGKALGPVGALFSGVNTVNDILDGNYGRGAYDGVMTVAGVLACVPPLAPFAAAVAGGMALGELVYDHWDDITAFTSHAADAVGDLAADTVDTVADTARSVVSHLNPFSW